MSDRYVPQYTQQDLDEAERIGRETAAKLDKLVASESVLFRQARRAAVEAASWARWNGAGKYEEMSAALHAALRVLDLTPGKSGRTAPARRTGAVRAWYCSWVRCGRTMMASAA